MPDVKSINVPFKGQTTTLKVGDWIRINAKGEARNIGQCGERAQIIGLIVEHAGDEEIRILLRKENKHPNWGDLGGKVPFGTGLSIYYYDLRNWFDLRCGGLQVAGDFVFKKKNLKGMGCKIVASLQNGEVFVEMDKDVGGGSCDGLGKRGHCITINESLLAIKTSKKKVKAKRRK